MSASNTAANAFPADRLLALYGTMARIRSGCGPQFLHALTYRVKGDVSVDTAAYRDRGEGEVALVAILPQLAMWLPRTLGY